MTPKINFIVLLLVLGTLTVGVLGVLAAQDESTPEKLDTICGGAPPQETAFSQGTYFSTSARMETPGNSTHDPRKGIAMRQIYDTDSAEGTRQALKDVHDMAGEVMEGCLDYTSTELASETLRITQQFFVAPEFRDVSDDDLAAEVRRRGLG
jgi:hypothetical protein